MIKEYLFKEVDRLKDQMLKDLLDLLAIPSKRGPSTKDAPYGIECKNVLLKAKELLEREGLETKLVDNKLVYGSFGDTKEYVGIFGHLDVVEEGDHSEWVGHPFEGKILDNRLYARGALDNKGPSIAALYGLLAAKNLGLKPKRTFRIVFGSNEETGMDDIKHYLKVEDHPVLGFVPDNKFPAIYGERGRAVVNIRGDESHIKLFMDQYFKEEDKITEKLGINIKDQLFGEMILRGIQTFYEEGKSCLQFNLSTPVCDIDKVIENIREKAKDLEVDLVSWDEWEIKNKESTNVKVLNQVYNEFTGENLHPTTTTGMTYAHHIKNVIPFGPSFPGQKGIAHLPNEWINLDDFVKWAKIYAYAVYKLNEVEEIIK